MRQGLSPAAVGLVVGLYISSWAVLRIYTGHLTDRTGRRWPIVVGMELVAVGIAIVALCGALAGWVAGDLLMGIGMELLYPTLLATDSDVAHPRWRDTSLGAGCSAAIRGA